MTTGATEMDEYWPCHQFQRDHVAKFAGKRILNCACKEDPGHLGRDFNAVNLDCCDYDVETQQSLYEIPNFVVGSALDLPFPDKSFDCVVLGEFLEHCVYDAAVRALKEAARVLDDDGEIVISHPVDDRPADVQRPKREHIAYVRDETGRTLISSLHISLWTPLKLHNAFSDAGLVEVHREELKYVVLTWRGQEGYGYGVVAKKRGH